MTVVEPRSQLGKRRPEILLRAGTDYRKRRGFGSCSIWNGRLKKHTDV